MNKQFTALLLALLCAMAAAQDTQQITVVSSVSGEPIAGAAIEVDGKTYRTGQNGRALVPLPAAVLVVSHPAYESRTMRLADLDQEMLVITLEPKAFSGTIVISGASKRAQSRTETSVKVEQLQSTETEFNNPQTAADLLDGAEGVYIQKSQMGGGSPIIRGFSTSRVLIVVDGIRMNNAIFRAGNVHNVISLDPHIIENTEVIYGPGSVIHGSDAIGGVMAFSTRQPGFSSEGLTQGGEVFTRYSEVNSEATGNVQTWAAAKNWSAMVSATLSNFGDMRMGGNGFPEYRRDQYVLPGPAGDAVIANRDPDIQRFTGYDQRNFSANLSLRLSDQLTATAAFYSSETSHIPRYDRLIQKRNGQFRDAEWYYGPQEWDVGWLRLDYQPEAGFLDAARLTLSSQTFVESRHDRRLNSPVRNNREEQVTAYALNLDLDSRITQHTELFYGAEAIFNRVNSTAYSENLTSRATTPISTRYPDESTWSSLAAYASLVHRLSADLTLNAGARFTSVSIEGQLDRTFFPFPFSSIDLDTSALSGSVGVTWSVTERALVFANLGTGFRAPNIDDVAKVFDSEPGAVVVPNPELESEFVTTADAGLLYLFENGGSVSCNIYYSRMSDAMVRRDFSFNGLEFIEYDGEVSRVQAIVNAEEATVKGIESSLNLPLSSALSLRASLNRVWGETSSGEALRHVAPPFGSLEGTYSPGPFTSRLSLVFNGEIPANELAPSEQGKPHLYAADENGRPYSPAWWVVNWRSSIDFSDDFTFFFGIGNLLDKRYRPYSSGVAAPGRGIYFAMKRTF